MPNQIRSLPAPISIDPTQAWEGNDGPWSTFFFGVGTPPQYVHVLISLNIPQPWVVLPQGCTPNDAFNCGLTRGGLYFINESSTWEDQGLYNLIFEENLGFQGNGDFGFDTVSLGLAGTGAPTVKHQIVAGIASKDFYLGMWGLGVRPTNITSLNNHITSLLSTMKEESLLPSLSFAYTAGAQYQSKQVLGSLTLGGYDASRFVPSNLSFDFAGDNSRDLIVGVQSITVNGLNNANSTSVLPTAHLSFIDSGVSHIWLPIDACAALEKAFGLQLDPRTQLYLINDTQHKTLTAQNINITFIIATDTTSAATVAISFPYAAFALQLTSDYPGLNSTNGSRYFPIRQAANNTQYTLGRAFLQQAYVIADYERSNFSVHPCLFAENANQDLRTISPLFPLSGNTSSPVQPTSSPPSTPLAAGAIAGIAIAAFACILIIIWGIIAGRKLRSKKRRNTHLPPEQAPPLPPAEMEAKQRPELEGQAAKWELHSINSPLHELSSPLIGSEDVAREKSPGRELQGSEAAKEMEASLAQRHEMEA